jgi:hypothetical protein
MAGMAPNVRIYKSEQGTFRTVERDTEEGVEVLVVGSGGERAHHTFASRPEATAFTQTFEAHITRRGFALTWATGHAR